MNSLSNNGTRAKSQKRKGINDASALVNNKITPIQSILDLPNYILIQNKDESPPGRSRSSGSSLPRAALRLIPATCNGNRINNKEDILYNKANFIF